VSSDELDPKLEAATRLYIYGREQNLRRLFLPTARRWLSGWRRRWEEVAAATEASERDSSLIDEILHDKTLQRLDEKTQRELDNTVRELIVLRGKSDEEIARFARKPQELECEKQDTLNSMVQKLYGSQKPVEQRFRPFAQLLADEEVRRRVSRRVTSGLLPIMDELFVLFETPERSETWTLEFERRLLSELQRIADEEIIKTASSGQSTTDQRTQQIGDRSVSDKATDGSENSRISAEIAFADDPRRKFIGQIIEDHPDFTTKRICKEADERRAKRTAPEQKQIAPREEWTGIVGEARMKEWMRGENLWERVCEGDSSHRVEQWISDIRKKLGLAKGRFN
jgi:hypothetical protein